MKKPGDPIYFSDFHFHAGINMTIRRGVEWDVAPRGVYLAKHPWQDLQITPIKIFETRVIKFADIPMAWQELRHDWGIVMTIELEAHLKVVYPHFNKDEIVTCVFFKMETIDEPGTIHSAKDLNRRGRRRAKAKAETPEETPEEKALDSKKA
jgi:hypothetical protein